MKRKSVIIFILILMSLGLHAQQPRVAIDSMHEAIRDFRDSIREDIRDYKDSVRLARYEMVRSMPHELRLGWGDQMFEYLMWREKGHPVIFSPSYQAEYNEHFRHIQHWFVEYLYNVNYWYAIGLQVDYSGVIWDKVLRNGEGTELSREINKQFHNIAIIPTVRFSYYHRDYVSLYSALGIGVNVNTGTEMDYKGRSTVASPAVNITLLGMRVGKGRWYGALEVGGLFALNSTEEIYMIASRIFTASVGVRL